MQEKPRGFFSHQLLISKLVGGAAAVALQTATALRARGDAARIWVPGEGPAAGGARELGLPVETYRLSRLMTRSRLLALLANWSMGRRLRNRGECLAHFHSPFLYRLLRFGVRTARVRSVVHVHLEEEKEGLAWALRRPPDLIITCARFLEPYVRDTLPEEHRRRQRIVSLPNAVDTEKFHPGDRRAAKRGLGLDPDVPLILMLANLAPHKGQETAIRAVADLKRRGFRCRLWMAGSERDTQTHTARLRALMAEEGVADVADLVGQRDDAPDLLRAADVLVLPSRREGLPLCLLEAQATKVPVLAAPVSGVPEVVRDRETGFLIPPEDAAGYARCIQLLLQDRGLYQGVVDRAYEKVRKEHCWRGYIEAVLRLYEEVLDGPRRGS
jgi:glycosyltransferase involved in cell wall biosynthesis